MIIAWSPAVICTTGIVFCTVKDVNGISIFALSTVFAVAGYF